MRAAWQLAFACALAACDPRGLGRPNPNFLVVGHRGAPAVAAENTIRSFQIATALGANAVETDLCITRDGVAVLWHDPDPDDPVAIARQSGAEGLAFIPLVPPVGSRWRRPVEELTHAELVAHYGYGNLWGERSEIHPLATLDDLLAWAADEPTLQHVYLDFKLGSHQRSELLAIVGTLADRVAEDASIAHVSFTLLHTNPRLARVLEAERSSRDVLRVRVALDYEMAGALAATLRAGLRDVSTGLTPAITWSDFKDEVAELVDARERGRLDSVTAWTFDEEQKLAELLYYSVDAVMTNDPALLHAIWQDTLD